ncbi:o-succinylbenzoate--CoA ligase [Pasteurellaceae bacterium Macca]|nr:o-succinylbenzoate--CoA ligase [Pasteurellaceae bacterium Macca]
MQSHRLFPSAFWAQQTSQRTAIIWEKGDCAWLSFLPNAIDWALWQALIEACIAHFQFSPHQRIAYSGESRFLALLCYCSAISAGGRILMLNPNMPETQQQGICQSLAIEKILRDEDFANFSLNSTACSFPEFDVEQPATFTLTSGSSGKPKAVVHSGANHLDNARGVCELVDFRANDSWLLSLPLFHVSGQGIVWRWLSQGATLFVPENKADFWAMLAQVSHASLVPTQLQRYFTQGLASQHKQHFLLGGSYIPPALIRQAQCRGIETYAGYGMTEMASTVCAVRAERDNVGKPLAGREVKIVGEEIWVKGAGLALGYWQNNQLIPLSNHQGWYQTKDRGRWNGKGQLVVEGRLDNMFISGGENIQPEAVESLLLEVDGVERVFIVPIADPEFGARPVAFVKFNAPFGEQAVENLQQFARCHLEKFRQPMAYFPLELVENAQQGLKISRSALTQFAQQRLISHAESKLCVKK